MWILRKIFIASVCSSNTFRFFEIDGAAIALAALSSLVREGKIEAKVYNKAEKNFAVSTERDDITSL